MGVYCVRNLRTGKLLVAKSVDLPSSLNRERSQLRFVGHPNRELQRDWNALGEEAFAFEVLDTLAPPDPAEVPNYDPRDDLAVLEAMWLERLQPYGERGYLRAPKESA